MENREVDGVTSQTDLENWDPFSPGEVGQLFRDLTASWWIGGGWAIDLFVGRRTRPHADIDVQVLRRDQLAVRRHLAGWELYAADPPGTLRLWQGLETLPNTVHSIWCRPAVSSPWRLEVMIGESDGDEWVYRRDPRIRLPLARISRQSEFGPPYLAPEAQLLFKAKHLRAKDEADFTRVEPLLDENSRSWLRKALQLTHPDHPWITRLS